MSADVPARRLPDDFLIGCASAAHQVEGGLDNDWTEMERSRAGAIADGSVSGIGCDHFHRWREDLDELARMHNTAHRFSVEWSRVEPREGEFDAVALRHYREVARGCRERGMEPIVTLLHFTLPRWLASAGGLRARRAPVRFARFAAAVAEAMGDDVQWWITINEPSVHVVMAYLLGIFPPNRASVPESFQASAGLLRMHAAAARAVREVADANARPAHISVAHHERRIRPSRPDSALDRAVVRMPDYLFNRWFIRSAAAGRLLPPVGRGEVIPGLLDSLDYLGLNYYCEESMRFSVRARGTLFGVQEPTPGLPLTAFGTNTINPEGLTAALHALWNEFGLPLLITENGISDATDRDRPAYILSHLEAVLQAIDEGVPVAGYLHWTQMDNFEWAEGYSQHFGLYSVDRETLERTPRPSAHLFAEICRSRTLPDMDAVNRVG